MKPARFEYAAASDVREAVSLLADSDGGAKVLAGGQSLVPMMNLRLAQPDVLVDIRRIDELRDCDESGDVATIGALITHSMLEDAKVPGAANGFFRQVASRISYRGVRNLGTVGGSLAHADPSADWPTALSALGAEIDIEGTGGRRSVPIAEFLVGAFTTALGPDEILVSVRVPKLSADARWAYYKTCRKVGEFADSIAAIVVDPERKVSEVVLGATGGVPIRLTEVAANLSDKGNAYAERFDRDAAKDAIGKADSKFDEIDLQIHATVLSRAVKEAYSR